MQDVLNPISQILDLPEDWQLKAVSQDVWAALWGPLHDIRVQHPRTSDGLSFIRGRTRGDLAGTRYATGWELLQHANHKLSARLGIVSIRRLHSGVANYDFELRSFVHRPGAIAITDHLQDFRGSQQRAVGETVYIPRELLGLPLNSAFSPIVISESSLTGERLNLELDRFFDASPHAFGDTDELIHITSSIIASNRHPISERAGWWRARNELIRKFIESNLGDQSLLPAKICSVFNLSRATLYRMFEEDGGVRRYIQDRRLQVAMWDLADSGVKRGRLTHVAEMCGFSSNANFNRAVKSAFTMPPGAFFAEGAYVTPARINSRRAEFPTYDWFRRQSEQASIRRMRA